MGTDVETPLDGCWEWPGARDRDGYGVRTEGAVQRRLHRRMYHAAYGIDPGERVVRHSCDNPPCMNPHHLLLGSVADNNRDRAERGRGRNQYRDATHCIRGHEFTAENTYINPSSGSRQCRICIKARSKKA